MNLYVDGSGTAVFDRDTGLQAATFKRHDGRLDGRAEARRYVGSRLVVEAAVTLVQAAAEPDQARRDRDVFEAAMMLFQSIQDSGLPTDDATQKALATLHTRAKTARGGYDQGAPLVRAAGSTDTSTTRPAGQ